MIIAVLDDRGVAVHADLAEVQHEHECIDVEGEAVKFYDFRGFRLRPIFSTPNPRWMIFVGSGQYHLEAAENASTELAAALTRAAYFGAEPLLRIIE